jgi:serine/threonine-protein kinase
MGEVIAARDEQIGRDVAIKRLKKAKPSDQAIARFLREARIQGRLEHPSIVPVHEIGRDGFGQPFFSMKKLAGTTMQQLIAKSPEDEYPRQRLLRAFVEVCNAIELAHTRGVIHRDIKPANIMLGDFGEVYVIDWGVAKVSGEADISAADADDDVLETKVGTAIGTPAYMAPEQMRGVADLDARADVYSLGCVLFEILSRQQFCSLAGLVAGGSEATVVEVPVEHRRPAHRAPDRDIPPELDQLCADATSGDREKRPRSARALGDAVQRFLDGDRDIAMRKSLAREHLATAQAAFAQRDSEEHRRTAIREAARALALDPTINAAADLVSRLVIEPPRDTPAEVAQAIDDDDFALYKNFGRISVITFSLYLVFIPIMYWVAPLPKFGFLITTLLSSFFCVLQAARGRFVPPLLVWVSYASFNGSVSWAFSPLLIAPGLAAVIAMIFTLDPRVNTPKRAATLGVLIMVGILAPWVGEHLGLLPSTLAITDEGVRFFAEGLGRLKDYFLAAYAVTIVVVAVTIAFTVSCSRRAARRQLQIQAWQLRQLVVE